MADFPRLLKEAAAGFTNEAIAYAQIRSEGNQVKVRMQSLEIARQFVGDVTYGWDPKGVLFYNDVLDFQIPNAQFKYYKHGWGNLVTIDIYFYEIDEPTAYARFIARVSPDQVPTYTYAEGNGAWTEFRAGSAQSRIIRRRGGSRLNLLFPALKKTAYFETRGTSKIDSWGTLLFRNVEKLKDIVNGKLCIAVISRDIIVFHPQGDPDANIGLFIPAGPLDVGSQSSLQEVVTWKSYDPNLAVVPGAEDAEEGAEEEGDQAA